MVNDPVHNNHSVRVLKKVRRQFLNKVPEEPESDEMASTPNYDLSNYHTSNQNESLEIPDHNKNLYLGSQFFSLFFNIVNILIDSRLCSKVVTLNLCLKDRSSPLYWETMAKVWENHGNLDFSVWARRFRSNLDNYQNAMKNYYEMIKSEDPAVQKMIRKTQRQAILMCKEIENKYAFHKYAQLLKKEAHILMSVSFSEEFLLQIGHSPESFTLWTREHGIPHLFDNTNAGYLAVLKDFVSFTPMLSQSVKEGEEVETRLYTKDGNTQNVKLKFIGVFEPRADAPFNHMYWITSKASTHEIKVTAALQDNEDTDEAKLKRRVEDVQS